MAMQSENQKLGNSEPIWTKRFIILCITNFVLFFSFFLLLSTLPLYAMDTLQANEQQIGLIIGIFTFAAILARPLAGYLLDRTNQVKFLIVAVLLFTIGTAGYLLTASILILLLVRFIHGFSFGMSTTAGSTLAAEWVPAKRRGEGLGYFGTFIMVAMSMGPMVGLFVANQSSYQTMFILCSMLTLVGLSLTLFLQKNQEKPTEISVQVQKNNEHNDHQQGITSKLKQSFFQAFEKSTFPIALCMLFIAIVFGGCVTFLSLYAQELGNPLWAGYYFFFYSVALIITRPIAGRMFDQQGPVRVVVMGSILYGVGVLLLGLANGPILLFIAGAIIGLGYGSLQPSYQALVIQNAPENRRGAATATFFTSFDIGVALGAFVLGMVANYLGYSVMFMLSSLLLLCSLIAFTIYWRGRKRALEQLVQDERESKQIEQLST